MAFQDVDLSDLRTNFYYLFVPLYVHPVLVTLVVAAIATASRRRNAGERRAGRIRC